MFQTKTGAGTTLFRGQNSFLTQRIRVKLVIAACFHFLLTQLDLFVCPQFAYSYEMLNVRESTVLSGRLLNDISLLCNSMV